MRKIRQQSLRPGVYSQYTVASRYAAPRSKKSAVLIGPISGHSSGFLYTLTSATQGVELLGTHPDDKLMLACCQLLFESGISKVEVIHCFQSPEDIIDILEKLDNVGGVISIPANTTYDEILLESILRSCNNQKERMLFIGRDKPDVAAFAAGTLNHERVVVCTPAVEYNQQTSSLFGCCALLGAILSTGKPNYNFNSGELPLVSNPEKLEEGLVQFLISNGATVLEQVGDTTECIRAITSRTTTNGVTDYSFRSINTILIIDDVITAIRASLKARLKGLNSAGALESVASQVLVELSAKQLEGIIEGYQLPRVYPSPEDPTVCVVELAFNVAHVISQIHITAHIGL